MTKDSGLRPSAADDFGSRETIVPATPLRIRPQSEEARAERQSRNNSTNQSERRAARTEHAVTTAAAAVDDTATSEKLSQRLS